MVWDLILRRNSLEIKHLCPPDSIGKSAAIDKLVQPGQELLRLSGVNFLGVDESLYINFRIFVKINFDTIELIRFLVDSSAKLFVINYIPYQFLYHQSALRVIGLHHLVPALLVALLVGLD